MDETLTDPVQPGLDAALDVLVRGGVLVYPTETLYALGCDARDREAVERVARIKNRPVDKPLPVVIGSKDMFPLVARREGPGDGEGDRGADMGPTLSALAQAFWPGPLSVLVRARRSLAPSVMDFQELVSVRVTPHPLAAELSRRLGAPLVATSANPSGRPAPARLEDLDPSLVERADLVVREEPWPSGGAPSTLVRVVGSMRLSVLRPGALPATDLQAAGFELESPESPD